jgi:hypothetical protein
MGWQNIKAEDKLDPKHFNEALWHGLMGQDTPYPELHHGRDLSHGLELLLQTYRQSVLRSSTTRAEDNTIARRGKSNRPGEVWAPCRWFSLLSIHRLARTIPPGPRPIPTPGRQDTLRWANHVA